MAFSSSERAAALIPNILNGASNYDDLGAEITPGSAAFTLFHSSGCALIRGELATMGYPDAIGTGHVLYDFVADIEANYVAYRAELSRSSPRTAAGERGRADNFKRAWQDGLKTLRSIDLTRMGSTPTSAQGSGWYTGGISDAEKSAVESDSDRVEPRFARGDFENIDAAEDDALSQQRDLT